MAPRSHKTLLLGYEERNQYRLWDTKSETLLRRRDVVFHEAVGATETVEATEDGEGGQDDEDGTPLTCAPTTPANPPSSPIASPAEKSVTESTGNLDDSHETSDHQDGSTYNPADDFDDVEDTVRVETSVNQQQEQQRRIALPERHLTSFNFQPQTRRSSRLANKPIHDYNQIQKHGFARVARTCPDADPTSYNQAINSAEHAE